VVSRERESYTVSPIGPEACRQWDAPMAKTQTRPWDLAEHLETVEDMAAYLDAALEDGDPALVEAVLGDIARAKGIAQIARKTGPGHNRVSSHQVQLDDRS
jgi:hypothetical protein